MDRVQGKLDLLNELISEAELSEQLSGPRGEEEREEGSSSRSNIPLGQAARAMIEKMPDQFTKQDLIKCVMHTYPDLDFTPKSIDNSIVKMRKEGLIDVSKPSSGYNPTVFTKVGTTSANNEHKRSK